MTDYIDREKAIEQTIACFDDPLITGAIVDALENVPKADVVKRNRARWEFLGDVRDDEGKKTGIANWGCPVCFGMFKVIGTPKENHANFCQNCGADMRLNEAIKTGVFDEQIQC